MPNSGLASIDNQLGGLPAGIIDLYGDAGTGRSAFGAAALAQACREGRPALLISSVPLDTNRMQVLGVPADLPVVFPETWYEAGRVLEIFLRDTREATVVFDTATGLESASEEGAPLTEEPKHLERWLEINSTLRNISFGTISRKSCLILINEARAIMGTRTKLRSAMSSADFTRFAARIQLSVAESVAEYGVLAYKKINYTVERSRALPPGTMTQLHLFSSTGFDRHYDMLKWACATGAAVRKGTYWIMQDGTRLGPGFEVATQQLREKYP